MMVVATIRLIRPHTAITHLQPTILARITRRQSRIILDRKGIYRLSRMTGKPPVPPVAASIGTGTASIVRMHATNVLTLDPGGDLTRGTLARVC
jgi:hypothetical protein